MWISLSGTKTPPKVYKIHNVNSFVRYKNSTKSTSYSDNLNVNWFAWAMVQKLHQKYITFIMQLSTIRWQSALFVVIFRVPVSLGFHCSWPCTLYLCKIWWAPITGYWHCNYCHLISTHLISVLFIYWLCSLRIGTKAKFLVWCELVGSLSPVNHTGLCQVVESKSHAHVRIDFWK